MTNLPVGALLPPPRELGFTGAGIREPVQRPHPQRRRQLPEWICFLMIRGSIDLIDEINGEEDYISIHPGEIHILPPRIWQRSARPFPIGSKFLWWHFTTDTAWQWATQEEVLQQVDQHMQDGQQSQWLIPRHCDLSLCLDEFEGHLQHLMDVQDAWNKNDAGALSIVRLLMFRLHEEGIKALLTDNKPHSGNSEERHVRQAQWLIREQYREFNSLAEIAAELDLNPAYLARCCKRVLNCSIGDLILDQRIRAAREFLNNSDMPLKEISSRCGFSSLNYFCRRFKQATGRSPGSFR